MLHFTRWIEILHNISRHTQSFWVLVVANRTNRQTYIHISSLFLYWWNVYAFTKTRQPTMLNHIRSLELVRKIYIWTGPRIYIADICGRKYNSIKWLIAKVSSDDRSSTIWQSNYWQYDSNTALDHFEVSILQCFASNMYDG